MGLPNFLVIGAGRAGTTSIHHYLQEHPQVFVPSVKSPSHFFCQNLKPIQDETVRVVTENYFVRDPAAYEALFQNATGKLALGEVSPVYLACQSVAGRIAQKIPQVKLLAVLRNPVDRVYARYVGRLRDGLERRDFAQVVADELREPLVRRQAFGTYLASGCCSHFLQTYFDHFPREQIRIDFFEDLRADSRAFMAGIYGFLGVDPGFVPNLNKRHNQSGGRISNPLLRCLWTRTALLRARLRRRLPLRLRDSVFQFFTRNLEKQSMPRELRARLTDLYRPDIERLQEMCGRDLSDWLQRP